VEIGPILRALRHSKVGAVLIALQIAFTMTVLVNAYFMIEERVRLSQRPSGVVEEDLFYLTSRGFGTRFNERVTVEEDLAILRETPGIVDAIQINAIPLAGSGWSMNLKTEPRDEIEGAGTAVYMVDEHAIDTLGVELIAGENFTEADVGWRERARTSWPDKTIVSRATAEDLFPEDPFAAVGQTVYIASHEPMTIIGIIDRLQAPWNGWKGVERSMLVPDHTLFGSSQYLIRTEPGRREEMMPLIEERRASRNLHHSSRLSRGALDRHGGAHVRHVARHRGARELQRESPHQADRHTPCARGLQARHPPIFPRGEFPHHVDGRRPRCGDDRRLQRVARGIAELPEDRLAVRAARHARVVADRSAIGLRPCASRGFGASGGGHAHRMT
jgi:hypothetical protein